MTFRKKDPDLVSLYFLHNGEANKVHQYRLTKRQEFVTTLQVFKQYDYINVSYNCLNHRVICKSLNKSSSKRLLVITILSNCLILLYVSLK